MEDFIQILLYGGFLLIYILSKLFKNRKQKPVTRMPDSQTTRHDGEQATLEQDPRSRTPPERKTGGWEEIFRQLGGEDPWEEERRREEEAREAYERQKRAAQQEADRLEEKVARKADMYSEKLGKSVREAKKAQRLQDKDMGEIDRMLEPIKARKARRGTRQRQQTMAGSIARSLRNPQSVRRAIILSEIINRKY